MKQTLNILFFTLFLSVQFQLAAQDVLKFAPGLLFNLNSFEGKVFDGVGFEVGVEHQLSTRLTINGHANVYHGKFSRLISGRNLVNKNTFFALEAIFRVYKNGAYRNGYFGVGTTLRRIYSIDDRPGELTTVSNPIYLTLTTGGYYKLKKKWRLNPFFNLGISGDSFNSMYLKTGIYIAYFRKDISQ